MNSFKLSVFDRKWDETRPTKSFGRVCSDEALFAVHSSDMYKKSNEIWANFFRFLGNTESLNEFHIKITNKNSE